MRSDYLRDLEDAARIADFYATENFRLVQDTILTDPVLRNRGLSLHALAASDRLQTEGHMHASMEKVRALSGQYDALTRAYLRVIRGSATEGMG